MTFWSGEKLKERLGELIDLPNHNLVDCAAYTLRVGEEYYVSPTDQSTEPKSRSLKQLKDGEAFAIPPGQFAYLQTEEIISIPIDALAFISIRAKVKWKGLVNVSGFHVDPGFRGKLTFAVFNAGPSSIHMRRGEPSFLIWYADLDRKSQSVKTNPPQSQIDLNILNSVSGELHSLEGLAERLRTTDKELGIRISTLERQQGVITVAATIVLTIVAGVAIKWFADNFVSRPPDPKPAIARPVEPKL